MLAQQIQSPLREIVRRTRGTTSGPITRLMSPSDLGHVIKPFVFLDLAVFEDGEERTPMDSLWHPHSGCAGDRRLRALGRGHRFRGGGQDRVRPGLGRQAPP